jgi:hypothetical protein
VLRPKLEEATAVVDGHTVAVHDVRAAGFTFFDQSPETAGQVVLVRVQPCDPPPFRLG